MKCRRSAGLAKFRWLRFIEYLPSATTQATASTCVAFPW